MGDAIVLYPSPSRGHLYSMIELGKIILKHQPSMSVIVIISSLPFETNSSDSDIEQVSATNPSITFIQLPTVSLPDLITPTENNMTSLFFELPQLNNDNLENTILTISKSFNIKALVIDFFCNAAVQVSTRFNIPTYYFWSSSASSLCVFLYSSTIDKNFKYSLKDVDTNLDIPGVPCISSKDMPEDGRDRSLKAYNYVVDTANQMAESAGIIVNTFESMEKRAVNALLQGKCTTNEHPVVPIYCVGPIVTISQSKDGEQHECLNWLDLQPCKSVLFLCFGSMGVFSACQLKDIATALDRTGVRFLWVVRNPPAKDETKEVLTPSEPTLEPLLPEGFLDRTKDRGFIIKLWAPQVAILYHKAIGGFVTHCGWNSILEAVCAGVPMLAWPLYAEQKLNRVFIVEEMNVALELLEGEDGFVSASELEARVMELMKSEKGKEVRERVMGLRKQAVEASSDGGSSLVAIAKFVESFNWR